MILFVIPNNKFGFVSAKVTLPRRLSKPAEEELLTIYPASRGATPPPQTQR
jgi:hypothetical protein